MGKVPRPGRVKTRLTRGMTPQAAALLYRAFLQDTFRLVDRVRASDWSRVFACALADGEDLAAAQALAPDGWRVVAQQGEGLGARIEHARQCGAAKQVVVMGSDSPTLPDVRLSQAFEALEATGPGSAAVAPTEDGGYALIAFDGPALALLSEIPWSTELVWASTKQAALAADIPLTALEVGYDVDHPEDLDRLRCDADPERHPATIAALASLR
ncbi:MAG: TIGR04282 family arsenosugar biosynthesis glycosyltransferase [Myxococcota bacterium]